MLDGPPLVSISECLMDASGRRSRYMLVWIRFGWCWHFCFVLPVRSRTSLHDELRSIPSMRVDEAFPLRTLSSTLTLYQSVASIRECLMDPRWYPLVNAWWTPVARRRAYSRHGKATMTCRCLQAGRNMSSSSSCKPSKPRPGQHNF